MGARDQYESLVRFYEFQLGSVPAREELKEALRATISERELQLFFLLPFMGMMPEEKLLRKAARAGISRDEALQLARRLIPEGMVDSYVGPGGRLYGRAPFIALLEFQVRLKEASPLRAVCTRIMDALIEGAVKVLPTKTPYYRVLPVEQTLRAPSQTRVVAVNVAVPDPREVLPIDVASEMVRRESLIVVADCYCRATKRLVGEECGHPLETCFYFNELGMVKLEAGYGRRVDVAEALSILRACEEAGLVHNVSNCEGKMQTLCNCCACSCAVMKAVVRGQTNVGAPSRYRSALIEERCTLCEVCIETCPVKAISARQGTLLLDGARCIGCGQCVSHCPEGALRMVLRERPPKIYADNDALFRRINMEAMLGLAARRLLGR